MDTARYLETIGYSGSLEPTLETLSGLQNAHLLTVPFEGLDCWLGNPVSTDPADAYRKVVLDRRGGFCYELNGLFAWLLEELGFSVARLAARPHRAGGKLMKPFSHLTLMVTIDGHRWLSDPGFGWPFGELPIDLEANGVEQANGSRRFRVLTSPERGYVEELGVEPEIRAYEWDWTDHPTADFAAQCADYATSPDSPFVVAGPVEQLFEDGWVGVTRTAVKGTRGGVSVARELHSPEEHVAAVREHFGLIIDGQSVRRDLA